MGCSGSSPVEEQVKFHELYKLSRKLGEGAFGQVRLARSRTQEGVELAVKIVDVRGRSVDGEPTKYCDAERVQMTRAEIKHWQTVGSNVHTVLLHRSFFERSLFYMVMEKCSCSLMDRLSKASAMVEGDLCRIFSEMLRGIQHVHSTMIVHRDIKPDNFLFGGEDGETVKLCDFGLAAQLPKKGKLKGVFGTAPYMSPEMLLGTGYDAKTDVWSFGATVFLMIHGDYPYVPKEPNATQMKKCIIQNKPEIRFVRPDDRGFFSRPFRDRATPFLQAVLQRAPATRRSSEEALTLPFLAAVDPCWASEVLGNLPSEGAEAEPETILAPVFRKARKATQAEKDLARKQPIKQTALESLLELLEEKGEGAPTFFSEGDQNIEEECQQARSNREASLEPRISTRRSNRFSTHSGVTSGLKPILGWDRGGDAARPSKSTPSAWAGGKSSRVAP